MNHVMFYGGPYYVELDWCELVTLSEAGYRELLRCISHATDRCSMSPPSATQSGAGPARQT